jgi:phosphopantothenoylcysteine decarboxylase/phosphopantothenate--cysteine ligase
MKILVGVCGGIAAYKAAELVRLLQQQGADVEVAMTASAERFITPLTFASLTGHHVYTSLWQPDGSQASSSNDNDRFGIEHIDVAQRIDALVIAPATSNILAKLAHGLADDFLTTLALATRAPLVLAPAMNVNMWQHPATQHNIKLLADRGARIVEPDAGYLACGMTGSGRLASIAAIAAEALTAASPLRDLIGETVLITAGGTREPVDAVRFLTNRSSGRMGHALAEAALQRGARVLLITASALPAPSGCETVRVAAAAEMASTVFDRLQDATIVIKAAAVSDFRVRNATAAKLHRDGPIALALEPTEDIAAGVVARRTPGTLVIAFAAETEDLEARARAKLLRKGVDAIVANDVSSPTLGFDSERNAGLFLTRETTLALPENTKQWMAGRILDAIADLRRDSERALATSNAAGATRAFD